MTRSSALCGERLGIALAIDHHVAADRHVANRAGADVEQLQGIGFFDGPLVNFTVEDNVVFVDHWHGVSLYDPQGSRIVGNLTYSRWAGPPRPWVMLGQKLGMAAGNTVHDNVAHTFDFTADASADVANNTKVDAAAAEAALAARITAIEATWGATMRASGVARLAP